MSYRKITVNGQEYQYVIGKTHVKIKGLGVWSKAEIGKKVVIAPWCDCGCYETTTTVWSDSEFAQFAQENGFEKQFHLQVKPEDIALKIKEVIMSLDQ